MTFTVGAIPLVAAAVLFILQPLLTGKGASLERTEDEMSEAEATRRVKLLALRDVEYDYLSGKLDEADYRELRRELSAEALAALDEAEREASGGGETPEGEPSDEEIEKEIARVRAGLKDGLACDACGHVNPRGSRFCSGCGAPLPAGANAGD